MKWKIVQYYGLLVDGKPSLPSLNDIIIKRFDSLLGAWLYKLFVYDFAEPIWRTSFVWKIEKAK